MSTARKASAVIVAGLIVGLIAGESLGALTVLAAYAEQPSRFRGLVIVDGITSTDGPTGGSEQVRANYRDYVAAFVDACVPEPDSDHLRRWGRQILERAEPEAAARMLAAHEEARLSPALADIAVPTLVIHGGLDAIVPVDVGRQTAARIPGAELVVIPDAGHVPTMTRPAQVAAALEDVAVQAGGLSAEAAARWLRQLEAAGRYQVEAWS